MYDKLQSGVGASDAYLAEALSYDQASGVSTLRLPQPAAAANPGQYFLVNVPAVALDSWHPFSASVGVEDSLVFHIKNVEAEGARADGMGSLGGLRGLLPERWTAGLAGLAMEVERGDAGLPVVRVLGPYGLGRFLEYEQVVLFAGGIGITPMLHTLRAIQRAGAGAGTVVRRATLVWTVPSGALLGLFEEALRQMVQQQGPLEARGGPSIGVRIHVTRGALPEGFAGGSAGLEVVAGRCNFGEVFGNYTRTGQTLAGVCGPAGLVQAVSTHARLFACDFHSEEFAF